MQEQNTFKRINETSIAVDGLVWTTNVDKAQKWYNPKTGTSLLNIVFEGQTYYPSTKYKGSDTDYILVKEQ